MSGERGDWTRRLARLRGELRVELEGLGDVLPLARRREELEWLLEDLDRQLERARSAAVVLLVGATGAGKSTLLNALVGEEVAREGETRPTTTRATVYAPEDADLSELLRGLPDAPEVVRYRADAGAWTEQVLVDAPDVNSVAREHRESVRALAERADVLLAVFHRQSIVEAATLSFLEEFAERRALVLVLNRADELAEEAREALAAQLASVAEESLGAPPDPPLVVSALEARAGRGGGGFEALRERLEALVRGGELAGVRRHNALGVAGEIGALAGEVADAVAADLEALPDELEQGLADLATAVLEEVDERLTLRRSELGDRLAGEAGARWDGPGGWALRAGGVATVGLGAGLAVARRNPLAALGLAAGSAVAQQVRDARGAARLESEVGLLPEDGELVALCADRLAPARVRAGRVAGDADAFGLPDAATLAEALQGAVGDAWRRLLRRGLPAAAERSAPRWLRLPLDLPVYGLAGFVVYRAGLGFWEGEYLGLDFLVNALLLAVAWVFVVRTLVRVAAGGRARGLTDAVLRDARVAVERELAGVRGPCAERAERRLEALRRVAAVQSRWRDALGQ